MRCTIITPCYNDGRFLPDLRASMRDGEDVAHIIVDDGSTDQGTLEQLAELGAEGVTVLRSQNGGPGVARNLALQHVKTRYVLPVDADDIVLPGAIRDLADALDGDPSLGVVWGDCMSFGARLFYEPRAPLLDGWWFSYVNDVMVGLMGRTEMLAAVGWDAGSRMEDWGMTLGLIRAGVKGRNIGRATYGYRQHNAARRLASARESLDGELLRLHDRYRPVFRQRAEARNTSCAPQSVRIGAALIDALPRLSISRRHELINRLSFQLWRRRWIHHPGELPGHPIVRRLRNTSERRPAGRLASAQELLAGFTDVIVVSPHHDDAVLSTFALVSQTQARRHVVNVFASTGNGAWDAATGGDAPDSAHRIRVREDMAALSRYANRIDLDLDAALGATALRTVLERQILAIARGAQGKVLVAIPAGAGLVREAHAWERRGPTARLIGACIARQHPEHVLARDLAHDISRQHGLGVLTYDEMPYHWARSGFTHDDVRHPVHVPVDVSRKAAALRCYESQLPLLFTREQLNALERWIPAVETYRLADVTSPHEVVRVEC